MPFYHNTNLLVPQLFTNNLIGWFNPDDSSTLVSSGGLVSRYNNKARVGVDFLQDTGASKPSLTTLNGRTALRFDGNKTMVCPNMDALLGDTDWTILMVIRPRASAGVILSKGAPTINMGVSLARTYNIRAFQWSGSVVTGQSTGGSNVAAVVTSRRKKSSYIDVSVNLNSSTTTFNPMTLAIASTNMYLGCDPSLSQNFTGDIGEILIYNTPLESGYRDYLASYLIGGWGI